MENSTEEQVKKKIEDMEKRLERRGRSTIQYAVPRHIFVEEEDKRAQERVKNLLRGNAATLNRALETGFVGSPETVAERIEKISETRVNHIIFQAAPTTDVLDILKEKILHLL